MSIRTGGVLWCGLIYWCDKCPNNCQAPDLYSRVRLARWGSVLGEVGVCTRQHINVSAGTRGIGIGDVDVCYNIASRKTSCGIGHVDANRVAG